MSSPKSLLLYPKIVVQLCINISTHHIYHRYTFFVLKIFSCIRRYENYFDENLLHANILIFLEIFSDML